MSTSRQQQTPVTPSGAEQHDAWLTAFSASLQALDHRVEALVSALRREPAARGDLDDALELLRQHREELIVVGEALRELADELARAALSSGGDLVGVGGRAAGERSWRGGTAPASSGVCPVSEPALRAAQGIVIDAHDPLPQGLDAPDPSAAQQTRDLSVAVLAHELRGPMSAILGSARLLRHPGVDPARRERALAVIEENAQLQRVLIDDLMDAARLGAHKVELEREPVDLAGVVACAVEGARPTASERGVTLTCDVPGAAVVRGDGRRLLQVVTNLVANALKFTPAGGAVTVSVAADVCVATLRVTDTGVGIAPELLTHVFECFHQGALPHDAGGLGLGLYLVRAIVEMHGGQVEGSSPGEGLGATFTVTLPLAG
ncbi:MAG: HAMP domain-containing sensor histidine kinase [Deltaproteobacteria bacterium]|nr:HAMP domain-containing sensor histidine kinase [Myxococcales bacterium]MDP3215638.1 HAMP domain-containing sensor histidine kinase [Deltaproteobacteria bacterium]